MLTKCDELNDEGSQTHNPAPRWLTLSLRDFYFLYQRFSEPLALCGCLGQHSRHAPSTMNQSLFVTRRKEAKPRKPGSRRCSGAKGNVTQRRVSDADETRKTATEELRSRMIKDPDWLIKQRTNRPQFNFSRTACTVVLIHYAMLKKSIKSFAAIFEKSRIKCYFLQRLRRQKDVRQVAVLVCYAWQFLVQLASEQNCEISCMNKCSVLQCLEGQLHSMHTHITFWLILS